jgi:hypothetical protein
MLTLSLSVNGVPITTVNAYRDMAHPLSRDGKYVYQYSSSTMPIDMTGLPAVKLGSVLHRFSDKINVLGELLLRDINKVPREGE